VKPCDIDAAKRPVNLTLNGDLLGRARAEGLNLSALAEEAIAAEIDQGCRVHGQHLADYGSLSDAVRASADAE